MTKEQLDHIRYMLDNLPNDYDKRCRWIGFIQGVLWSYDIRSIDEMRHDIKTDINNGNKELKNTVSIIEQIIN